MEVYLPRSWLQSVVIAYTKIELFKEIKIFYLPGWRSAAQKIGLSSCVRFARKTWDAKFGTWKQVVAELEWVSYKHSCKGNIGCFLLPVAITISFTVFS